MAPNCLIGFLCTRVVIVFRYPAPALPEVLRYLLHFFKKGKRSSGSVCVLHAMLNILHKHTLFGSLEDRTGLISAVRTGQT